MPVTTRTTVELSAQFSNENYMQWNSSYVVCLCVMFRRSIEWNNFDEEVVSASEWRVCWSVVCSCVGGDIVEGLEYTHAYIRIFFRSSVVSWQAWIAETTNERKKKRTIKAIGWPCWASVSMCACECVVWRYACRCQPEFVYKCCVSFLSFIRHMHWGNMITIYTRALSIIVHRQRNAKCTHTHTIRCACLHTHTLSNTDAVAATNWQTKPFSGTHIECPRVCVRWIFMYAAQCGQRQSPF